MWKVGMDIHMDWNDRSDMVSLQSLYDLRRLALPHWEGWK